MLPLYREELIRNKISISVQFSPYHVSINFFSLLEIKELIWVNNDTFLCIRKVLFLSSKIDFYKMKVFPHNVHPL